MDADLSNFEGSWTLFESMSLSLLASLAMADPRFFFYFPLAGLMTSISDQIYEAMAFHVSSEAANSRRLRQVSVWGIQRSAEVLIDMLRGVVDPVGAQFATV